MGKTLSFIGFILGEAFVFALPGLFLRMRRSV